MTIQKKLGDLLISKFANHKGLDDLTARQQNHVFRALAHLFIYKFSKSTEYDEEKIIKLFNLQDEDKSSFLLGAEHLKKHNFIYKQSQTNTQKSMTKINTILENKYVKDIGYYPPEPLDSEVYYLEKAQDDKVPDSGLKIFKRKQSSSGFSVSRHRNKDIEI